MGTCTQQHAICITSAAGKVLHQFQVEHSGQGLGQLVLALERLAPAAPERVAVAIEVPRGPLVETLLERGFRVFAINPKQLDRFRDRHSLAGSKNDTLDAYVLADALRTDLRLFRALATDDPLVVQLREASRTLGELTEELGRLSNRLRDLLLRYFPQLLALCSAADEPWLWELLKEAATPMTARELPRRKLAKLLREHRIRRLGADELRQALAQPDLRVAPGVVEAASAHVRVLVPQLQLLSGQRRQLERGLEGLLAQLAQPEVEGEDESGQKSEHRDAKILLSLPGVGIVVAAAVLGEASQALAARDYDTVRAMCGVAPVTKQSGRSARVVRRHACNQRLENAAYHWSRVAAQHDPRAQEHYQRLRAKGQSHGRALRGVSDRLLNILIGMLKSKTLYNPARGEQRAPAKAA